MDKAGNLYGTTQDGGTGSGCKQSGCGTVFELVPSNGKWTEKVLHSFCTMSGCPDGWFPWAGLIADSAGDLYGTTYYGGNCEPPGCGTVFELIPHNGKWTEKVLYKFCSTSSCPEGRFPRGRVILDTAGNLYGTTNQGGAHGVGAVFELVSHNGKWTEKELHIFNDDGKDGQLPYAGLIRDNAGNLYGTTGAGGTRMCASNTITCGTVFELTPGNGKWTEKVLHRFNDKDGAGPEDSLIMDASGNLYGTTESGGANSCSLGCGTVFELIPGSGKWMEKVLYSFSSSGSLGNTPVAGLIVDSGGNLYGTATSGGTYGDGTAFELIRKNGRWTETLLHAFNRNGEDGAIPWSGLILDKAGNLYGTTGGGGSSNAGTVYEITP
jgi:uncharacterized repeat protein (TIGR03803 family)